MNHFACRRRGGASGDPRPSSLLKKDQSMQQIEPNKRAFTGLVPSELAILQVYVVDDFGDRLERWVGQAGMAEQHLEAAAVALMGEFGLEHVEAQLAEARRVALR
jgi:hypothetical protein